MNDPLAGVRANTRLALAALIPPEIAELRGWTFEERQRHIAGAVELIGGEADQMMFASNRGRKPSGVLPALVRGMAVLAYQPGGVTVLGVHACAVPHPWCPASLRRPPCCTCDPGACTATAMGGRCPDSGGCGWCGNGCTGTPCCTRARPLGWLALV